MSIPNVNDGTQTPPRIRLDLNWSTLWSLPKWSAGPRGTWPEMLREVFAAGFEGVQHVNAALVHDAGLRACGMARAFRPDEILPIVRAHQSAGFDCTTLQVGNGLETDNEMDYLAAALVNVATILSYPLFLETHRATMTQDMRRTVDLVARHPELRFNADLSHWYTGHEMAYGDFDAKLRFIEPVLERVRFVHGRVSHAGSIQVPIINDTGSAHRKHFEQMWTRCFKGFIATGRPGDVIVFAPELLPAEVQYEGVLHRLNYAPTIQHEDDGSLHEIVDRWTEAKALAEIGVKLFQETELELNNVQF